MTDSPINWGISSTGGIAESFAQALVRVGDARLLAVSSRSDQRAQEFAGRHDAPRAYGALGDMLADRDVDVVYIASPQSEHCREALLAVEAGKHVLVEKPFGLSADQVRPVLEAARRRGVFVMEALWTRFLPASVRLRELVEQGTIGDVMGVQASFGFPLPDGSTHRLLDPGRGGGALLDLGIYSLNTGMQLLGPPDEVLAMAAMGRTGVDVNTGVMMRFSTGAIAYAAATLSALDPATATITGTRGCVEIPTSHHSPEFLTLTTLDHIRAGRRGERLDLPTGGDGLRYQVHEVHACLRRGVQQSDVMSWQHTLDLMTALDSARACIGLEYPAGRG